MNKVIPEIIEPGATVVTDGWSGYREISSFGYHHKVITYKDANKENILPVVNIVVSLLKRWLLGTHQGAVRHSHLDYYLDEFVFRFNRRKSKSRGKLFYRMIQQAVQIEPVMNKNISKHRESQSF
jgi:transposase-like protein